MQGRKPGEERVMATSTPTMSLVSRSGKLVSDAGLQSQNSDRSGIGTPIVQMQNRLTETRLSHHNFEISNVEYLEKVFSSVRQKLSQEEDQMLDVEVNGIVWGKICVSDNEGSSSSRTRLRAQSVYYQGHRFRAAWNIVRYFAKIDPESRKWNLWDLNDRMASYSLEKIFFATWQSNQAVESKGTRLLRFGALSRKDARIPCRYGQMERTNWKVLWFQTSFRIIWNRRRAIWARVKHFPRTHYYVTAPRDSDKNDDTRNQTRRIQRSDHLHLNVQWHRLVKRSKNVDECFPNSLKVTDYAQISKGTLVFSRSRKWRKTVRNAHL